jgi:hypothetical protein
MTSTLATVIKEKINKLLASPIDAYIKSQLKLRKRYLIMNLPKLNLLESAKSSLQTIVYNDFFDNISKALQSWTGKLQNIGLAVIVFCVCIIAFMFMFGEGPSRTAKKWLMYIVIGGILLWGAGTLGSTVKEVTGGF